MAFERLALAEFEELGLADTIRAAVQERVAVASRVRVVLLGEASGRYDEGVTWEPSGAHLGMRIEPARFDQPARLSDWAGHVLGHAEDTLDPDFGFRPGWIESALARPAQARFHVLWDVSVDARREAPGRPPRGASRAEHRAQLAARLPRCPARVIDGVLDRLWDGPRPTFAELVTWAADRNAMTHVVPGASDARHPDHCPLCRFPSDDVLVPGASLAEMVASDYPDWRPEHGLCGRCTDRYRFIDQRGGHQ